MRQRWEALTFVHWSYEASVVQRLLPEGLMVEPYDDRAWVGLIPFHMRVGLRRSAGWPWLGRFCETNVRTYVRDAAGRSGIWFFSLDASRLAAVLAARAGYALPYFWSAMSLTRSGRSVDYACERRWPAPRAVHSRVSIDIGEPYSATDLTDRDHFLTARWTLFSDGIWGLRYADAEHRPWPLWRAELRELRDGLVEAAGLPAPTGAPLVHFSEGVDVRIGWPHLDR
ncbi:MAG: uncharacterized protein QOF18_2721 [Frankiaceae bacterium]|jgi:uncharacterized protein YqjF (DUF2071 family)|nr:uncharacterized protein [Frankiaceae bacterium]